MEVISVILDEQRKEDQAFETRKKSSVEKMPKAKVDPKILEERAVSEATASADASFNPSPSALSSNSSEGLLSQVDGPSLIEYQAVPNVYTARSVPVVLRGSLTVPIHVIAGGSVVEYTVECENNDICFGITAEREEGITVVTVSSLILYCELIILLPILIEWCQNHSVVTFFPSNQFCTFLSFWCFLLYVCM